MFGVVSDQVLFTIKFLECMYPRKTLNRLVRIVSDSADNSESVENKTLVDSFDSINVAFKIDLDAYDPTQVYTGKIYVNSN